MSRLVFEEKESNNVQIVRALGIIAVVGIHTCGGGIRGIIVRPLINYAVSIFVFLSGLLTSDDLGGKTYLCFIKKRIMKILPPYIIWSIFFTVINGNYNNFILNLLTGRCEGIYYFVFVYIQIVLITPLVLKLIKSKHSWIGWFVTPLSIIVFYYVIGNTQELSFPFSGELCIFWFTYYYLGLYIRNIKEVEIQKKSLIILYIFSLVLQLGEGLVWNTIGNEVLAITQLRISSYVSSFLFCLIAYSFIMTFPYKPDRLSIFIKTIGDYSYGIYLIHMAIIRLLMKLGVYDYIVFPINWIVILIGTTLVIFIVKKILGKKISRVVVGS